MADKNNNLDLYEKVRKVPKEAQKPITGGRLSGMTDINPMWRIKTLTEQFGVCGVGWYPEIVREWVDTVNGSQDVVANVEIKLYIKVNGEWSQGISGIGGSKIASMEKNGLYVNDECYKSAYTDALSVVCKQLGIGADIYWDKDTTKYNDVKVENFNKEEPKKETPKKVEKAEPKKEEIKADDKPTQEQLKELQGKLAKIDDENFKTGIKTMYNIEKKLNEIASVSDYNEITILVDDKLNKIAENENK